jgi:hypothetical protein
MYSIFNRQDYIAQKGFPVPAKKYLALGQE